MGLTKQYLRYVPGSVLNIIASANSNVKFIKYDGQCGRFVAVGACDNVYIWDTRKGEKFFELPGSKHEVSVIESSKNNTLAVGYTDGAVRIFDLKTCECLVTFSGHKREVTSLGFDEEGLRLASGSKDTNVCVWDIVAESGIVRLSGHKKRVSQVRWLNSGNIIVSSSDDMLIKFFDMDTNHCFKTLTSHRQEVLDFIITFDEQYLISGTKGSELKVFKLTFVNDEELTDEQKSEKKRRKLKRLEEEKKENDEGDVDDEEDILKCNLIGTILRQQSSPVQNLLLSPNGSVFACQGKDSTIECFRLLDAEEAQKRFAKKQKKAAKRARESTDGMPQAIVPGISDEIIRLPSITATGKKTKSVDLHVEPNGDAKLVILLATNSLEVHGFNIYQKENQNGIETRLVNQGHRTEARSLAFSSDNIAVASASAESVKIWGRASLQCIRTMPCDRASCILFVPGDRHILVGCKSGNIQIFDIASGSLLNEVEAHSEEIKSLNLSPDQRGFISGSLDKTVRFWDFQLVKKGDENTSGKVLTISCRQTLTCDDAVLCTCFSPDHRLVAVSTSDFTVKLYFVDTHKLFLTLYGHKLPVVSMDISSDSRLIITGSEDRNVKIWGLDFGDCHKSLFAHDDGITSVQFVAKTHMFFSVGKDGKLKQWDADNFERIITLDGHFGPVFSVAITLDGKFVATSGMDRSIRLWERTNEPLVLEDERETEREEAEDDAVATEEGRIVPGDQTAEATLPSKKTAEAEKAAERLMEALDVYDGAVKDWIEFKIQCKSAERKKKPLPVQPQIHPLMLVYGTKEPNRFMLESLRRIKSSELEEALLVLPMDYVTQLLIALEKLLQDDVEVELISRILFFLLRLHHGPVTGSPQLSEVIDKLRFKTEEKINLLRDTIGFNMAALEFLQREIEEKEATQLFLDATVKARDKRKKKTRKDLAIKRAVLAL